MTDNNIKKQLPKNLFANVLSFGSNILIGIWLVPYLLSHIGTIAYGLSILAMFFSEYINIIIMSLNNAINRFLIIALQSNNVTEANKIFNTSLVIMICFGIIQTIIMIVVLTNLSYLINIPDNLLNDTLWLFSFTFLGFTLSLIRAVFTTPLYARNRLDLIQYISITQTFLRILLIVTLFSLDSPSLKYLGLANFIASLAVFIQTVYLSKKLVPELKTNLLMFDKQKVRDLFKMGSWVLVGQLGGLLFLKIDLYLANIFLGSEESGRLAIIIQINSLIRMMIGIVAGVISPIILIYYAKNEIQKLIDLSKFTVKGLGLLISIPIGFLCATSGDVLAIWLGESFRSLDSLVVLSLAPLVINLAVLPLFTIFTAFNKVKIPGLVTIGLGIVNVLLIIFLITQTNLGLYGLLLGVAVILTLKNIIFTPIYASYLLKINFFVFIKDTFNGILGFIFVYSVSMAVSSTIQIDTFLKMFIVFLLISILSILFMYYILLNTNDKLLVLEIIPEKFKKYFLKKEIKNA